MFSLLTYILHFICTLKHIKEILSSSNHNGNLNKFESLHQENNKSFTFGKKTQTNFHCKDQRNVRITLPWKRNDHYIDTLSPAAAQLESLSSIFLVQPSIPWALTSEPLPHSFCFLIDSHYLCELVIFWKKTVCGKAKKEFHKADLKISSGCWQMKQTDELNTAQTAKY